jgi:RHS repeat-associated protein
MSLSVDPNTNHITTAGFQYDGNGNVTNLPNVSGTLSYDIENRTGSGNVLDYDLENQPLLRDGQWNLYGLHGERLATYSFSYSTAYCTPPGTWFYNCGPGYAYAYTSTTGTRTSQNIYFAGRLIQSNNTTVLTDRTGSVRANETGQTFAYYPFGEEIGAGTANGREKFATYTRESSGLDYADQRYFTSTYGAFLTPDRLHTTAISPADPKNPSSWNRYAYAGGDPANQMDPTGTDWVPDGNGGLCSTLDVNCIGYNPGGGATMAGGGNPCPGLDPNLISALEASPQAPTFYAQAQSMGCGPGNEPPDDQHVTALLPSCAVEMFTRPIEEFSKVPGFLGPIHLGSHSYLEVLVDGAFGGTVEGYHNTTTKPSTLDGLVTEDGTPSIPGADVGQFGLIKNNPTGDRVTGALMSIACAEVNAIELAAENFNPVTYHTLGVNSNSFMHWLLGLFGINYAKPPGSKGWNNPVPNQ